MRTVLGITLVLAALATPALAGLQTQTFDTAPTLASSQTPGAWYTDRYAPAIFEQSFFDGDNRLRVGVRSGDSQANRPGGYGSDFYNYQGRKFDTPGTGFGSFVSVDLYADTAWQNGTRAGIWATASNGNLSYPIIEFAVGADNSAYGGSSNFTGLRWWQSGIGWTEALAMSADDAWHNLKIELTPTDVLFYHNDVQFASVGNLGADSFDNIILQAHNQGVAGEYDVYWDNLTYSVIPAPGAVLLGAIAAPSSAASTAPSARSAPSAATPSSSTASRAPYVYDVDGNRYVDLVGTWGPAIVGHATPRSSPPSRSPPRGASASAPAAPPKPSSPRSSPALPSVDLVRFVNSGTEAA
jgi:hypothetical protein